MKNKMKFLDYKRKKEGSNQEEMLEQQLNNFHNKNMYNDYSDRMSPKSFGSNMSHNSINKNPEIFGQRADLKEKRVPT